MENVFSLSLIVRAGSVYTGPLAYKCLELDSCATRTFIFTLHQEQPGISHQKMFKTILAR